MNLIETLEREAIDALTDDKTVPEFRPGDTLRVGVKVVEGDRTRVQNFEGVCIARSNKGIGSSFTVRKISFGEGVERVFPLYSPNIDRSRSCAAAPSVAPSSITCAAAPASRRASPSAARSADSEAGRRPKLTAQACSKQVSSVTNKGAPIGAPFFVSEGSHLERA